MIKYKPFEYDGKNLISRIFKNTIWSDIFLMEEPSWENGILFWPVKLSDSKLNTDITTYENKWLGFRRVSSEEMAAIDIDPNIIYTYLWCKPTYFK